MLRIKELLKEKAIAGKDLADMVGVSPNTISNVVKGNNFPKPELLKAIAEALDVDIRELFYPTKEASERNRLIVEHDGKYYPIGEIDKKLFAHFVFDNQLAHLDTEELPAYEVSETTEPEPKLKKKKTPQEIRAIRVANEKKYEETGFNSFWEVFHKSIGLQTSVSNKAKSFELWERLSPERRETALRDEPQYFNSSEYKRYSLQSYLYVLVEEEEGL